MTNTTLSPVLDGWFSTDDEPHLLGTQCAKCNTYYFPKQTTFCKNPACDSEEFAEVPLSRTGKLWSFTNACYKPPAPYVVAEEEFKPYAIAAVELDKEKMVVLGQVATGYSVEQLKAGMDMELVLETLPTEEGGEVLTWKWKPVA